MGRKLPPGHIELLNDRRRDGAGLGSEGWVQLPEPDLDPFVISSLRMKIRVTELHVIHKESALDLPSEKERKGSARIQNSFCEMQRKDTTPSSEVDLRSD